MHTSDTKRAFFCTGGVLVAPTFLFTFTILPRHALSTPLWIARGRIDCDPANHDGVGVIMLGGWVTWASKPSLCIHIFTIHEFPM